MIKSKNLVLAAALFAFAATSAFAQEVSFENKLESGIVNISIADGDVSAEFAGLKNTANAEYSSDKLDLGAKLILEANTEEDDSFAFGSEAFVDDYFIEFRPIDLLGIGFHKGYAVAGSFLPCLEKEIDAANIGSDFGVFVRPIEGLTIGAGLDLISYFGREGEKPLINFGAEYALGDKIAFGAALRNIASDERSLGAYASFTGVEGLTLNAGFTYNGEIEDVAIAGNFANVAVMFSKNALNISANAVVAFGGEADAENELYVAANENYMINDTLFVNAFEMFTTDFDNDDSWCVGVSPSVGYMFDEHNTVGAGVYVNLMKSFTSVSVPVYWKYNF